MQPTEAPDEDTGFSSATAAQQDGAVLHAAQAAADSMPVFGPIMHGLDALQAATGLPWWAVISLTAVGGCAACAASTVSWARGTSRRCAGVRAALHPVAAQQVTASGQLGPIFAQASSCSCFASSRPCAHSVETDQERGTGAPAISPGSRPVQAAGHAPGLCAAPSSARSGVSLVAGSQTSSAGKLDHVMCTADSISSLQDNMAGPELALSRGGCWLAWSVVHVQRPALAACRCQPSSCWWSA